MDEADKLLSPEFQPVLEGMHLSKMCGIYLSICICAYYT
jgi:hypothetical protein